jgi:hypothetical protein
LIEQAKVWVNEAATKTIAQSIVAVGLELSLGLTQIQSLLLLQPQLESSPCPPREKVARIALLT